MIKTKNWKNKVNPVVLYEASRKTASLENISLENATYKMQFNSISYKDMEEIKNDLSKDYLQNYIKEANNDLKLKKHHDLIDCCMKIIPQIKKNNYTGIVGVPRSGMFPASIIALHLSVPLYSICNNEIILLNSESCYGGNRMNFYKEKNTTKLLVIDDSSCTGTAAKGIKERFNLDIATCYATIKSKNIVDFYGELYETPHIFEWNFFDSHFIEESFFDIDGVMSPNVPIEICIDEERYIKWIKEVDPIFKNIPMLRNIKHIITGRLEKYRNITEEWLDKHSIKYKTLTMFPSELESVRNSDHVNQVGMFKAKHFMKDKNATMFIESEIGEAKIIKDISKKNVITTKGGSGFELI
jgi:uncharacterized HAD superfamily protein/adenine/guanine phosphoribosyltransferase-like PRPP-binding protein